MLGLCRYCKDDIPADRWALPGDEKRFCCDTCHRLKLRESEPRQAHSGYVYGGYSDEDSDSPFSVGVNGGFVQGRLYQATARTVLNFVPSPTGECPASKPYTPKVRDLTYSEQVVLLARMMLLADKFRAEIGVPRIKGPLIEAGGKTPDENLADAWTVMEAELKAHRPNQTLDELAVPFLGELGHTHWYKWIA